VKLWNENKQAASEQAELAALHSYINKMTYKPSKLGHTDLVFGL